MTLSARPGAHWPPLRGESQGETEIVWFPSRGRPQLTLSYWMTIFLVCVFTAPLAFWAVMVMTFSPLGRGEVK